MAGNQRLNATITIGGVVSATLGRAVEEANSRLGNIGRVLGSSQNKLGTAIRQNNVAIERSRAGVLDAVGAFYTLKGAIAAPVQAAMDFESAMADVKKVVDFPTPKSLEDFKMGLRDLSTEVPIAVTGLAEIAAAAGQAGIAGNDLVMFTESAAKIGVAFDISAGEAGDAMAKLKTGLGLTIPETVKLFDAMNHLSNAQASSAPAVLDVVRRVGAMGKQFGFTAEESAAFGSAMIASGAQSEVAATSFLNMGRALTRGESATKRQSAAMAKLGLNTEDVAVRMQQDAVGTTIEVMEKLAELPKHVQASVSSDLFGDEARALGPLLTNLDLIRESVGMVSNEADYAGSAFNEFVVRNAVFASKVATFKNNITDLAISIGEALIPRIGQIMDALIPVITIIGKFTEQHPQLASNLALSVGGLIAFKGALSALRFVGLLGKGGALSAMSIGLKAITFSLSPLAVGLRSLSAGLKVLSVTSAISGPAAAFSMLGRAALGLLNPFRLVGMAIRGLGMIFAANPIGAAITVIAGGAYLLYKHWGEVGAWFGRLWGTVKTYFGGFVDFVSGIWTGDLGRAWGGIKAMWTGAIDFFKTIWSGIGGVFTATWTDIIKPVLDALGILEPIKSAWSGLKEFLGPILDWLGKKFEWLMGYVTPFITGAQWVMDNAVAIGDALFPAADPNAPPSEVAPANRTNGISRFSEGGSFRPIPTIAADSVPEEPPANHINGPSQFRAVGGAFRAGPLVVGERGREAMFPDRGGFIAHNRQLIAMARNATKIAALGGALSAAPLAALPNEISQQEATATATAPHNAPAPPRIDVGGVTIYAQPGQDPRQIADAVLREIDRRARGALYDTGGM